MGDQRFDSLARHLASGTSRRRALRALAAGTLGLLGGMLGNRAVAKACLREGKDCKRGSQCCSGSCQGKKGKQKCRRVPVQSICTIKNSLCPGGAVRTECGTGALSCACLETTQGHAFCALNQNTAQTPCTSNAECDARIGQGAACVRVGNGCAATVCIMPCPDPV
jgi:hypothetical protein